MTNVEIAGHLLRGFGREAFDLMVSVVLIYLWLRAEYRLSKRGKK